MTRLEHATRRRIIAKIENQLLEDAIGVPGFYDFIFIDPSGEPVRVRRCGDEGIWMFYWCENRTWMPREKVTEHIARLFWNHFRVLSAMEIKHFNLLGGVKLAGENGDQADSSSIHTEPTDIYGTGEKRTEG
jgi:hypothetical protein